MGKCQKIKIIVELDNFWFIEMKFVDNGANEVIKKHFSTLQNFEIIKKLKNLSWNDCFIKNIPKKMNDINNVCFIITQIFLGKKIKIMINIIKINEKNIILNVDIKGKNHEEWLMSDIKHVVNYVKLNLIQKIIKKDFE